MADKVCVRWLRVPEKEEGAHPWTLEDICWVLR